MQIPGYFEDMNYLHVNTEPDRAYYIPASGKGCYFLDREKSDRFLLLSGSWQFQYFESVYDLPQEFWKEGAGKGKEGAGSCRMAELRRGWKPVYQHPVSISL